jgi:hypothetical protein
MQADELRRLAFVEMAAYGFARARRSVPDSDSREHARRRL